VVILSARGGTMQPWIVDLARADVPRPIDIGDLRPTEVTVSDDGAWIVLAVFGHGLHAARTDGSAPPRPITKTLHDFSPSFVHGTHDVVFHTVLDDGSPQIQRLSLDGGEPRILVERDARAPSASPREEKVIYLAGAKTKELVPMIFDLRTRRSSRLAPTVPAGAYTLVRFTPDSRKCLILKSEPEQLEVDVATGVVRTIPLEAVAVAFAGGKTLLATPRWEGDVWIAEAPYGDD